MRIISAKKLSEALTKAQGVGLVEERFTIGDCEVVLRNLRPDEYESIIGETHDEEDLAYLNAYQKSHVSRSIVELNGQDLRDVQFVDVEEDDPKTGKTRSIKIELHAWITKNILNTWSKEAIFTAYRKIGDVVTLAEERAKAGITFRVPEESRDDKYRRILGELREAEEDLPLELVERLLADFGYMRKTTAKEAAAVDERLAKVEPPPPEPVPQPPEPAPDAVMARRQPLNQLPVQVPSVIRTPPPLAPDTPPAQSRAAKIAALEGDVDSAILAGPPVPPQVIQAPQAEVAELSRKQDRADPKGVSQILDQPPTGGINPRYRNPNQMR